MTPISLLSMMVAEEKEKNTLRTLMLSDVSAEEFLLSKSLVALFLMTIIAIADFLILKGALELFAVYLISGTLAAISLLFLGAMIGLLCKDQMATGTLSAPVYDFYYAAGGLLDDESNDSPHRAVSADYGVLSI